METRRRGKGRPMKPCDPAPCGGLPARPCSTRRPKHLPPATCLAARPSQKRRKRYQKELEQQNSVLELFAVAAAANDDTEDGDERAAELAAALKFREKMRHLMSAGGDGAAERRQKVPLGWNPDHVQVFRMSMYSRARRGA